MDNTIINFINQFTDNGKRKEVIECFTQGCCYWFAEILSVRFSGSPIMYAPIDCHFGCKIGYKVYDITGDVTTSYKWIDWYEYKYNDPNHADRIVRDCILKEGK